MVNLKTIRFYALYFYNSIAHVHPLLLPSKLKVATYPSAFFDLAIGEASYSFIPQKSAVTYGILFLKQKKFPHRAFVATVNSYLNKNSLEECVQS